MFNRTSPCERRGRQQRPLLLQTAARAAAVALVMATPLRTLPATTDLSATPLPTYTAGSTVDVKPNILFVLDDSGSMDWDFLPDWVTLSRPSSIDYTINYTVAPAYLYANASYNGVAYNPAVTYSPPVTFTAAGARSPYASMTGTSTATGGDGLATSTTPNWNAVKYDAYGVQSADGTSVFTPPRTSSGSSTYTLTNNASYYTIIPGEYCTTPSLTNCNAQDAPNSTYQYAAPLRWCSSTDLSINTCKGLPDSTYKYPRIAAPLVATLTFPTTSSNRSVTGVKIGADQIMSGSTASDDTASTIASRVADKINACTTVKTGNCAVYGYSAQNSGRVVYIFAPGKVVPSTPVATTDNTSYSATATAFAKPLIPFGPYLRTSANQSLSTMPGDNVLTVITSANDSYPYPGTAAKAVTRTDCAGTTCTFKEEMTNYANWWTYYHTRMQMMKSATTQAFSTLDSATDITNGTTRYRVGYFSLNNNTTTDLVNVADFTGDGKFKWYSKLVKAKPSSGTALRGALSDAGRLYAGKLNGRDYNGVEVTEPMQYACQRNYTILSTDGFWNGAAGYKLDGTSAIGNQDGLLPRPYKDGASSKIQQSSSQLQSGTATQKAQKGTLQSQTSQLQSSTSQLQAQTAQLYQYNGTAPTNNSSSVTWGARSTNPVASCTWKNSGTSRVKCEYDTNYSSPSDVGSCTTVAKATSTSNGTVWSGPATRCAYTGWSNWAGAASCTALAQSGASPYSVGTARQCQTVTPGYVNALSCVPTTTPAANGNTTQCQYSFASSAGTSTCLPTYVAGNFSNATVYSGCSAPAPSSWTNVAAGGSCTITAPNASGQYTTCQYGAWGQFSDVPSCTAVAQSTGPTTFNVAKAVQCQAAADGGTDNTLADVAAYYYNTDLRNAAQTGTELTGTCTAADGKTDLCANNVIAYGRDTATWQHMTVHTLGLGAQGQMVFSPYQNNAAGERVYVPDYWTQPSGDFSSVANGSTATSTVCTWMSGTCTWPKPVSDTITNIDDLWHTAVNGHGTYFSATDPASLSSGLSGVLAQIVNTPRPGTAAAAASSNPNITSSDNFVFSSSYQSVNWFGELIMQRFNDDGSLTDQQWSAMRLLDCATTPWKAATSYSVGQVYSQGGSCYLVNNAYTSGNAFAASTGLDGTAVSALTSGPVTRNIYMAKTGALVPFTWGNLTAGQQNYFTTPYLTYTSASQGLSQFCAAGGSCLSTTAQTNASGSALIDYLSGVRTNEVSYYRARMHVLGDIVSSEARYVKVPTQGYLDTNYAAFTSLQSSRVPTVYVGANDGMLHAFDALTGQERWAYVPTAVLPNLYRLADMNYGTQHQYFVDGTAEVGDICPNAPTSTCSAAQWRTIIVGGLNQGGNSYYALDITDPGTPTLLWEFTDPNMGQSYSNPRITKLADGTWAVMVASGYNNTADGVGRLFVLNASTGALLNTISTGVGTATSPSGLAKLAARSSGGATNNTVDEVYGGDLLGNLWRFDVNGTIGAAGTDAQLMISLKDPAGVAQPITSKPTVASVNSTPLLIVGTGRYLGLTDLTDSNTFSMYAVKYATTQAATLTTPRTTNSKFVNQTLFATTCPADSPSTICDQGQSVLTVSSNPVNWGVDNGWYLDFANAGERSVTDATLALGTLAFTTVKPQTSTTGTITGCTGADTSVNAQSFLYYLDFLTGGAIAGTGNVAGELLCTCVATRPSVVKTPTGTVEAVIRMSGGGNPIGTDMGVTSVQDLPYNTGGGTLRRTSWRELNGN